MESFAKLENTFKCEICEKTFKNNESKCQHIRSAHGETKFFACNVCNKIFETKNGLNFHLKNHQQEDPRKFKCDSCGQFFTQSGFLKTHVKTIHEKQRNYKCDLCKKKSLHQEI